MAQILAMMFYIPGTVSAAIEGWMMGYNSIAISLASNKKYNFYTAAEFIADFIEKQDLSRFKERLLLNINVPDLDRREIKGVKICGLGTSLYEDTFEERLDPSGRKYYWLKMGGSGRKGHGNTDISGHRERLYPHYPPQIAA